MGHSRQHPLRLADFVRHIGESVETTVSALYWLVKQDPQLDRTAIVNVGCSNEELNAAEDRVQHTLHPLHRWLLTCSNGGTIPFLTLSLLAPAIPREQEWRIVGPFLTAVELARSPVRMTRLTQPIPPLLLSESLRHKYGDAAADQYNLDNLVVFAAGYGGENWGYQRGDPARIKVFQSYGGTDGFCDLEADNFAAFLDEQTMYQACNTTDFVNRVREAIASMQDAHTS